MVKKMKSLFMLLFSFSVMADNYANVYKTEWFIKKSVLGVEWIKKSSLKENLLRWGWPDAIRIQTVSTGEEIKPSISQVGAFINYLNGYYYKLDYKLPDITLPQGTSPEEVKGDPKKLLAALLGEVDSFYGFPDTVYYILPHFESDYLVLYLLGYSFDIPYDQLPLARRVGDFLAIPLVGYPVQYCNNVSEAADDSDRVTDFFVPLKCEGSSAESAKYIRMQTSERNKKLFEYKPKPYILPSDFFDGPWLFTRTVVETSKGSGGERNPLFFDFDGARSVSVKFSKNAPDQLNVVDFWNRAEEDRMASFSVPVSWKGYEMDHDGETFKSFGERETESDVKPYMSFDFQRLADVERSQFPEAQLTIKQFRITHDSFSFDVEVTQQGKTPLIVIYAFKKPSLI